MAGPLSGLRVMDVAQLAVGPLGAAFLGQLGAEVIKVEVPDGDLIRNLLPHMNGVGTYYASVNVNKKNIALNLKEPRDLEIAFRLAERCDVALSSTLSFTAFQRLSYLVTHLFKGLAEASPVAGIKALHLFRSWIGNATHFLLQ